MRRSPEQRNRWILLLAGALLCSSFFIWLLISFPTGEPIKKQTIQKPVNDDLDYHAKGSGFEARDTADRKAKLYEGGLRPDGNELFQEGLARAKLNPADENAIMQAFYQGLASEILPSEKNGAEFLPQELGTKDEARPFVVIPPCSPEAAAKMLDVIDGCVKDAVEKGYSKEQIREIRDVLEAQLGPVMSWRLLQLSAFQDTPDTPERSELRVSTLDQRSDLTWTAGGQMLVRKTGAYTGTFNGPPENRYSHLFTIQVDP